MLNTKSRRLSVAVAAAAVLIVAAGGGAIASNMGFKINLALVRGGAGNIGKNQISLPYINPYTLNCTTGSATPSCVGAFCQALALPGGLGGTTVTLLDQFTGLAQNPVCPTATATTGPAFGAALVPGKMIQVRMPNTFVPPAGFIIVGSHNPTTSVTVPLAGVGLTGRTWFSVPYHTTAVTHLDLCTQAGLRKTLPAATVTTLDPITGISSNAACSATTGSPLVLGRGVQLTQPNVTGATAVTFIPAHF